MVEPRRSNRIQSTSRQVYADSSGVNDQAPEPVAASSSRAKRQKTSSVSRKTNPKRKGKGKLRLLPEMPLDILFEIFGHVLPLDLLRLAWTSKALRSTLMRRSARSVWKQALSNVEGLPECPEDLTEPQWALLAFYPYCHYCGTSNTQTVAWACRVRSCVKCLKEHFLDNLVFAKSADYEIVSQPALWIPGHVVTRGDSNEMIFPVTETNKFIQEVTPLLETGELQGFLDKKEAELDNVYSHAGDCYEWQNNEKANRSLQRSDAKERRWLAVCKKLTELGWEDELANLLNWNPNCLLDNPLISQPKDLTNRIWNNIRGPLVEFMEKMRVKRIQDEKVGVLVHREAIVTDLVAFFLDSQSPSEAFPSVADVCQMKEFSDVIEYPIEVDVQTEDFDAAVGELSRLSREWREEIRLRLLKLLPPLPTPEIATEVDPSVESYRLDLATSYFRCNMCSMPIDYPRILFHKCMTCLNPESRNYEIWQLLALDDVDEMTQRFWSLSCEPWDYDGVKLKFDNDAFEVATHLVRLCGLSPERTTKKQMNALDPRFACNACSGVQHKVMSWKVAINHYVNIHSCSNSTTLATNWTILSSRDAGRARTREGTHQSGLAEMGDFDAYDDPQHWKCSFCKTRVIPGPHAIGHMTAHGLDILRSHQLDQHVYYDPDAPDNWPHPVYMRLST